MEFFPPGKVLNIMRYRNPVMAVSAILVMLSLVLLVFPGPRFGTDFAGGTEVELAFTGRVTTTELRSALSDLRYTGTDVIAVQGHSNQYILRVREVSTVGRNLAQRIETSFRAAMEAQSLQVEQFRLSPGGDKISVRLSGNAEPSAIETALEAGGAQVRVVNQFGGSDEHRFEAQLVGLGDRLVAQLRDRFGEKVPDAPLRVEWVGPRAGQQLQEAAIQSVFYALLFIMVYVAFRFDIRFAPGAIASLFHDVVITLGAYVLLRREVALTTVAACLTILGYSINDTIVVYDRIRENIGRERGKSLSEIIDISTSQVLSRSIVTSGTTIVSILPFLYFGTTTVKDIALAFTVGMTFGTYSSIYIASPITEWFDRMFFKKLTPTAPAAKKATA